MFQNTPDLLTEHDAAALVERIAAIRPEWSRAHVMASLARSRPALAPDHLMDAAMAAANDPTVTDIATVLSGHAVPAPKEAPTLKAQRTDEERKDRHIASIAHTIPQSYDDLSPELIAEDMYARGVRKLILNIDDSGPTQALRDLIDEIRSGHANAYDLDTALNILEVRLNIPLTTADDVA